MKLSEIAKKPQLMQVTLADEEIVKEFGEPLEFYTWDRQPIDVFMRLSSVDSENTNAIMSALRDLVLDEKGKPVLKDDATIPGWVLIRVMNRVVEDLGKF